jgi:hypothetical protein
VVSAECAARLAAWSAGVAAGQVSIEAAARSVEAGSNGHLVSGLPGLDAEVSVGEGLAWVRDARPRAVALLLPTSGSPLGLTGASPLSEAAVIAEAAAVFMTTEGCLGWIPEPDVRGSSYFGVRWRVYAGSVSIPAPAIELDRILDQADRALRRALRSATDTLRGVDLAQWRAEMATGRSAADAALRPPAHNFPPRWPPAARALGERSLALWAVLRVAASDPGAASASGAAVRADTLRTLSHVVRETAMTAFNLGAAAVLREGDPPAARRR